MAVTGSWEWTSINQKKDSSVTGGVLIARNNWSMTRRRISTDTYTSELGDTSQSLSGYNGGETFTITPETRNILTFGTDRNWVLTTDVFVEAGYQVNNRPVYVPFYEQDNIPSASMTKVIYAPTVTVDSESFYWTCCQITTDRLTSKDLFDYFSGTDATYYNSVDAASVGYARQTVSVSIGSLTNLTPNSVSFASTGDGFGSGATASTGTQTGYFYCESDSRSFNQRGVNWYTQTQVWTYKDPYVFV